MRCDLRGRGDTLQEWLYDRGRDDCPKGGEHWALTRMEVSDNRGGCRLPTTVFSLSDKIEHRTRRCGASGTGIGMGVCGPVVSGAGTFAVRRVWPIPCGSCIVMTIKLTEPEFDEQLQETDKEELCFDPHDERDITYKFGARFMQGWLRKVWLREGIFLHIEKSQLTDDLTIIHPPNQDIRFIQCRFLVSGNTQVRTTHALNETSLLHLAGQYHLISNGVQEQRFDDFDCNQFSLIHLDFPQRILHSFAVSLESTESEQLQHLRKPVNQSISRQVKRIQPEMTNVLQQVWHCPYEGIVKRAYLESKAIELIALVLGSEIAIQQGERKQAALKPEQIERVYYAREILLRDLGNPPTLEELAHQVGLNDFLLKRGFHQAFGTTVFEVLQSHRMDIAKQLLAEGKTKVSEIGLLVGYASVSAFTRAFKRRFDMSPKAYQKKWTGK